MGGKFAHVLAVILMIKEWKIAGYEEVPSQPSSSSLPQQWDRPRGSKIQAEPVSQLIISRPGNLNRKRKPVMSSFNDNRKVRVSTADFDNLKSLTDSPISYLASYDTPTISTPIGPQHIGSPLAYHAPLMNPIKPPSSTFVGCGDLSFPKEHDSDLDLKVMQSLDFDIVNIDRAKEIERETRGDRELLFKERKYRITASNFGSIIKRKKEYNDSYFKNTFDKGNFTSAPTSYGIANETVAKQMYINKTGNHVHDIGLVVNQAFPFLGATPDGSICDDGETGVLKIKCPFSARDMTINEACMSKDFFLKQTNGKFYLDKNHIHWFQVPNFVILLPLLAKI